MLLSNMGNSAEYGNSLLGEIMPLLASRLPKGWRLARTANSLRDPAGSEIDAVLTIRAPGNVTGSVLIEAKARIEPKDTGAISAMLRPTDEKPVVVAARFISPRTQECLKAAGFGYADLTGNVLLRMSRPGLFVETTGARENPEPSPRDRRSLRGAKAARLVRALCDFRPPVGLRELAKRTGVDPGYASRVVAILDREALLVRAPRGPINSVDWAALLRRWSQEYSPFQRGRVIWYLAPRGVPAAVEQLKAVTTRYAVSGSWAASQIAPVAPPRLLLVYADRAAGIADALELAPTEAGANVAISPPLDSVVYDRTSKKNGINLAAVSQVAADLLTGPGRGPNEAEALMKWMAEHENAWRT